MNRIISGVVVCLVPAVVLAQSEPIKVVPLKQWTGLFPRKHLPLLPREAKQDVGAIVDARTFAAVWKAWSDAAEGQLPDVDFTKHFVLFLVRDAYEAKHSFSDLQIHNGVLKFRVEHARTDSKLVDQHPMVMSMLPRDGIRAFDTGNGVFALPASTTVSVVSEENYKKIIANEGKWSEADVTALLGQPQRYRVLGQGTLEMVYEDVSRVRIEFEKDRAAFIWGEFSPHLPSKKLNLDNFRKLQRGMTMQEVKGLLGTQVTEYSSQQYIRGGFGPFDNLTVAPGTSLAVWQKLRRLVVQISDGKVSGYSWTSWLQVQD